MTRKDKDLYRAAMGQSYTWNVTPGRNSKLYVFTGKFRFSDGDDATLLIRREGDNVVVSDCGCMSMRFANTGVALEGGINTTWNKIVEDSGLHEVDGRVIGYAEFSQLGETADNVARTMLELDKLRESYLEETAS